MCNLENETWFLFNELWLGYEKELKKLGARRHETLECFVAEEENVEKIVSFLEEKENEM